MAPLQGPEPTPNYEETMHNIEQSQMATPPDTRSQSPVSPRDRTKVVVVGLGMVGMGFIEKLLDRDSVQKQYSIIVLGEEKHVAYNRLDQQTFTYKTSSAVTKIDRDAKKVHTAEGAYPYDICVLATGSEAVKPKTIPGYDAKGVFVYRTIGDLEEMIEYADKVSVGEGKMKQAIVVGGGLLGLEAAHAVQDMEKFDKMTVVHRSKWLLSQQLDQQGGDLLTQKVRDMGVEVLLEKQIKEIHTDDNGAIEAVTYMSGERCECQLICFAIGIRARDDLGIDCGLGDASTWRNCR
ncbi:hypothetical protein MRB53_040520 [Persea americana]|nr:hypothetical protein MRB53_040520 [Persea americana]